MTGERPALAELVADPVPWLRHPDARIRRLAVAALGVIVDDDTGPAVLDRLQNDTDVAVRAEAAEVLGGWAPAIDALVLATREESRVAEAAITALARLGHREVVPWLMDQARSAQDALVREASVAALGEIGDERAVSTLIDLAGSGSPQVRRRAVVALTVFDGDEVEAAIRKAASDRNPMVREAAEMVVGRPEEWQTVELRLPGED